MGKITRRMFLSGTAGGVFGFLGIRPEDTGSEATGKVLGGAAVGAGIGAVTGIGDKAHSVIKPKPSRKYTKDADRFGENSRAEYYREQARKRSGEGKDR